MEVNPGLLPVALHGPLRDAVHRRNLREPEAAEELQIDDAGEAWVDAGELVERLGDPGELHRVGHGLGDVRLEGRDLEMSAALLRLPAARVIDDQASHDAR